MSDRLLRFNELKKLFEYHGCSFEFNKKTQFIKIYRGEGGDFRRWFQHAHKGSRDSFDKMTVARARRKLGFSQMSDEEFYGAFSANQLPEGVKEISSGTWGDITLFAYGEPMRLGRGGWARWGNEHGLGDILGDEA